MIKLLRKRTFRSPGRIIICALFASFVQIIGLNAQGTRTVSGKVSDQDYKGAIPGVNVIIKGSTSGTTTDANGEFTIDVSPQDVLVFSFVGYQTLEVSVDNQTTFNIELIADITTLSEIVVVGYGEQKKVNLTGAVATVNDKDLVQRQTFQVSEALQGQVAGVTVTRNNSAPGATSTVRIRGVTTFNTNDPLVIIDGVPQGALNDVNPNDIESISVLKDAAAASIYGSRAAAGVILITTKRGKEGKTNISYNYEFGSNSPTALPEFTEAKRYQEMFNERESNDGNANRFDPATVADWDNLHASNPDLYPNTNWQDEMLSANSTRQRHSINLSGGTKSVKTNVMFNYDTEDGLYVNREYNRYTARINNDISFTDKLSATVDLNFKHVKTLLPAFDDVVAHARRYPGIYDTQYEDGRWALGKDGINPMAMLYDGGTRTAKYNKLAGRIVLDFKPIKGLSIKGVVSPALDFNKVKEFNKIVEYTDLDDPSQVLYKSRALDGLEERREEEVFITKQLLINYGHHFGNHEINALVGYEDISDTFESLSAGRDGFDINTIPYLNLGSREFIDNEGFSYEYGLNSYFGRVQYNYNEKYLFEFNLRADASSRFAPNHRTGYFPSVSAGWIISDESFMSEISWLTLLKLRASYGTVGNERVSGENSDAFKWWPFQALINFRNTLFYQNGAVVSLLSGSQTDYAVSDIEWERTKTTDVGIDASLLDSKLSFSFDYYQKRTDNILMTLDIPNYLGYVDPVTNVGEIEVKGWDFQVTWKSRVGDFNYSVSANLSDSKSTVIDVNGRQDLIDGATINREGFEFNEYYGYQSLGLFQTQDDVDNSAVTTAGVIKPGDIKYKDQNDDDIINEQDRVPLGGTLPRYIFGGNINVVYKGFDLGIFFQGVGKQTDRLNSFQVKPFDEDFGNAPAFIDGKYWSVDNTEMQNLRAKYPRLTKRAAGNNYAVSDFWLINGSYMRIKNIVLGYTIPNTVVRKAKINGVRVYISLKDYFAINRYPTGWDPEVDATSYPIMKSFTAGINVKF